MDFAHDDEDAEHRVLPSYSVGGQPPPMPPAMMPGKGVRAVRCVGCREDTLPRPEDGAPLCQRCSELLSSPETLSSWTVPKWLRRRPTVYF